MIVTETLAECEGCGERVQAPSGEHPEHWARLQVGDVVRYFCSTVCLLHHEADAALPAPPALPRVWPHGLGDWDVRILELIALGCSNKEIAATLGRSESNVKNRLTMVFAKLGAFDRTQAVLAAHAAGILNLHQFAQRFADQQRAA